MTILDPLKRITLLYHFTDRRNLPSIRSGGNEWNQDADGMKGRM